MQESSNTDVKKRILQKVPLAELIGETIPLQNRSGRKTGLCPFHEERSPSFTIYDDHYFCFGCRAHGDAIDFVRHQKGLGFRETLRYLAGKYQVDAPELAESERYTQQRQAMTNLYRAMNAAQEIFVSNLKADNNESVNRYLEQRGFPADCHKEYGFGIALDDGQQVLRQLRKQGFSLNDLEAVALISRSSERQDHYFDFFRDRLMIPIRDPQGRLIAFGGRTLGNHPAKYKNSRETPLFDKSSTLFGADRARQAIRNAHQAIIVEGYMDALQLWQNQLPNTVACLGTALTAPHLHYLAGVTKQVVLLFDGDSAGQNASLRSVEVALTQPEISVKVAVLPAKHDPDSFVRKEGTAALQELIRNAVDLVDFAVTSKVRGISGLAVPEMVSKEFVPWLCRIPDRLQRSYLVTRLAHLSGIAVQDIENEMRSLSGAERAGAKASPKEPIRPVQKQTVTPPPSAMFYELCGHLHWAQPGEIDLDHWTTFATNHMELAETWEAFALELIECLREGLPAHGRGSRSLPSAFDPAVAELLQKIEGAKAAFTCDNRAERLKKLEKSFQQNKLRASIATLKNQVSIAATDQQNPGAVTELLTAIRNINEKIERL